MDRRIPMICTCDPDPEDNEDETYDLEEDVHYDQEGQPDWLTEWHDFDPEC